MIKAVLFDLDGVLIDACDWHYEALNRALEEVANDKIEPDEHESVFNGLPTRVKLDMLVKAGRLDPEKVDEVRKKKQALTLSVIREKDEIKRGVETYKGALRNRKLMALVDMLLADGIKVGCVTNSVRESAVLMLDRLGILTKLGVLLTSDDLSNPKPHPEGYWRAMIEFKVFPKETLIIEDSPKGQEAGKNSGAYMLPVKNPSEVTWLKIAEHIKKCV